MRWKFNRSISRPFIRPFINSLKRYLYIDRYCYILIIELCKKSCHQIWMRLRVSNDVSVCPMWTRSKIDPCMHVCMWILAMIRRIGRRECKVKVTPLVKWQWCSFCRREMRGAVKTRENLFGGVVWCRSCVYEVCWGSNEHWYSSWWRRCDCFVLQRSKFGRSSKTYLDCWLCTNAMAYSCVFE